MVYQQSSQRRSNRELRKTWVKVVDKSDELIAISKQRFEGLYFPSISLRTTESAIVKPDNNVTVRCELLGNVRTVVGVVVETVEDEHDCDWLVGCYVAVRRKPDVFFCSYEH